MQDLEALIETANPLYERKLKQTEHVTQHGSIFSPLFVDVRTTGNRQNQRGEAKGDAGSVGVSARCFANSTGDMTADQLVELIKARFPTLPGLNYTGFRPIVIRYDLTQ